MSRKRSEQKTQISTRIRNEIYAGMKEVKEKEGLTDSQLIEKGLPLLMLRYLKMDPLTKAVLRIVNAATLDEDWLMVCFKAYLRWPFAKTPQMSFDAALETVNKSLQSGELPKDEVRAALEDE